MTPNFTARRTVTVFLALMMLAYPGICVALFAFRLKMLPGTSHNTVSLHPDYLSLFQSVL